MSSRARVLLVDLPWSYNNRRKNRRDNPNKENRFGLGAADRYMERDGFGGMTVKEMCALSPAIRDIVTTDAYCFMWATCPMLAEAQEVLKAWGFKYVGIPFFWTKTTSKTGALFKGPGRYVPSNMEPVLLGVRARPWHTTTGPKPEQEIRCPHPRDPKTKKIIHSRKPPHVHERIEEWLGHQIGLSSMIELFATEKRPGWVTLGGAISGLDIREELEQYASGL